MRSVLRYLDNCKSTYNQPFARLCKDIATARHEANNNVQYLAPLEPWFDRLENAPYFLGLPTVFRPMMHLVLLVWKNSPFYNTAARLVVLMRQIANALIDQARKYVNGEIIFSLIAADETEKAVDMLRELLKVIGSFKSIFFDYKAKANAECVSNPWRVQNVAVFMRLEAFLERCHDILDLTETVLQFSKLSKIEIGGTKGKTLTTSGGQAIMCVALNTCICFPCM
jgi:dynein heavy chain